jgi:hypothetical protein
VLPRAQVRYFKHNDTGDLERVLLEVAAEDRRLRCAGPVSAPARPHGHRIGAAMAIACGVPGLVVLQGFVVRGWCAAACRCGGAAWRILTLLSRTRYSAHSCRSPAPCWTAPHGQLCNVPRSAYDCERWASLCATLKGPCRHHQCHAANRMPDHHLNLSSRSRKPLNRRFIVVEGIYAQYGDLAPLAAIHALKCKYRRAPVAPLPRGRMRSRPKQA